jgi:hypothetical protein
MAQLFLSLVGLYHDWMNLGRIKPIHGREYDYETRLSRERELLSRSLIPQNIWPTLRGIQVIRNNGQSSLATGHRSNCPKSSISINQKDRQAYIDHEGGSQLEQNATIVNLSGKRTKYKRRISIFLPGLKSSVVIDKGSQQATRYISILSRYSFVVRCSGYALLK